MLTKDKFDAGEQRAEAINQIVKDLSARVQCHLTTAFRTCINCVEFDEPKELCKLANARPPARVIALGCDSYIDTIPF